MQGWDGDAVGEGLEEGGCFPGSFDVPFEPGEVGAEEEGVHDLVHCGKKGLVPAGVLEYLLLRDAATRFPF